MTVAEDSYSRQLRGYHLGKAPPKLTAGGLLRARMMHRLASGDTGLWSRLSGVKSDSDYQCLMKI
jgi:hypothetical protein